MTPAIGEKPRTLKDIENAENKCLLGKERSSFLEYKIGSNEYFLYGLITLNIILKTDIRIKKTALTVEETKN
jgi:hypothetical protein